MKLTVKDIKDAVKEAIKENGEVGISPIIIPPLREPSNQSKASIPTLDVMNSFLSHKEYKRLKKESYKTYEKHFRRFARKFPTLPLDADVIMGYLDQFKGETGRYKRNQHDLLNMLYGHAVNFFGIDHNPIDDLERPIVTERRIRTLSWAEARKVDSLIETATERAVWELTFGHGWRQIEIRRITAGDVRSINNGIIWCHGKERDEDAPLLPETQQLLEQLSGTLTDSEPVIRSAQKRLGNTQPLGASGVEKLIQRLFQRAGIKYKGHDLRRSFCTLISETSGDEFLAMRLARNKIPGVNDRYINAHPLKLRDSLLRYSPIQVIRKNKTGETSRKAGETANKTGENLVETGESRTPRPEEAAQDILQA